MVKIENEIQYQGILKRVEELMNKLPDTTPEEDPEMVELILLGNLIAEYDAVHYPVGEPSLVDVIKLRMYEKGLTQSALAKLIGVSPARVCDLLSGKCQPTLKMGKNISQKLDISPSIVLGV